MTFQVTKGNVRVLEGKKVKGEKTLLEKILAHLAYQGCDAPCHFDYRLFKANWQRGAPSFVRSLERKLIFILLLIEVEIDFISVFTIHRPLRASLWGRLFD